MTPRTYRNGLPKPAGIGLPGPTARRAGARLRPCGVLSAAMAALLAACGGGGGGDSADIVNTEYAVQTAMGHVLQDAGSWSMTGTGPDGQAFTLTMAFAPLPTAPVPIAGGSAARSVETLTIQIGGQTIGSGGPTFYYNPSGLSFIASDDDTGTCSVVRSNTVLPTRATIGANGDMFAEADYDGCASDSLIVGNTLSKWSLETQKGVVLLCWTLASQDMVGTTQATQSTCIQVAPDGTLGSKSRFVVSALGTTLIDARNF